MEIGNRGSRMKDENFGNGRQNMRNGKRNGYAWFRMLCITACIMLLLLCAAASFAEGTIVFEGDETITRVSGKTGGLSNNQAAAGYINRLMKGGKSGSSGLVGRGTLAGDQLSGAEKKLYKKLKEKIEAAAAGNADSTEFLVPYSDIFGAKGSYTLAELGFSEYNDGNSEAVLEAFTGKYQVNVLQVMEALLADCPYDLYWYDKTVDFGYGTQNGGMSFDGESIVSYVDYKKEDTSDKTSLMVSMVVAQDYRDGSDYQIDTTYGTAAARAAETARGVVADNAGKNDFEKLTAYKNWICNHVDYNDDAAKEENNTPYGDPWQMVWVFDGNDQTKVVCEGYSKAFQYLCDESEFTGNVTSILAMGMMGGGTGAGAHMWNLVQTETDGPWYMVDVTNSDEGSAGEAGGLFMDGYDSQDNDWYLYNTAGGGQVAYSFDEEIAGLYGDGYPLLSESAYTPAYSPELRVPERIAENENLQINIFNATDVGFIRAELTDPNNPQSSVSSVQGVEFAAYKRFSERPEPGTEVEGVSFSGDQLDAYIANTRSEGLIFLQVQLYGWPEEGQDLGELLLSQVFIVVRGSGEAADAPVMLINGQDEDLTVEPYSTVYFGAVLPEGTTGVRILTNQNWAAFEKATQGRHVSLSHNELSPGDSFTCYAQITKDEIPENTSDWTSVVNWKAISEPVKVTAGAGQPAPAPEFTWNAEEGTIAENEILEIEITNIPETDGRKHYYAQFQKALGQGDEEWDIWQAVEWDEDTEKIWIWTSRSLAGAFMNPSLENAGRYQIRICAENEGYVKSFSEWRELTVSKADPADSGWLCLQADSILCGDEVRVMAYDPQASQIRVEILENSEGPDDPVIHNWSMDGNLHNWKYQLLRSGSYTVRAFSGQYTGDELEEELIGEKELEVVARETLDKVGISGVKDAYRTGEYAEIAFSTVDHADGYEYTIMVERDDGSTETIVHTGEPAMLRSGTISFRISEAGQYTVKARAYARGYEETIARKTFVALEQDPEDTFTLTVNGQTGETSLVTHAPAELRILAPGAKTVRVLTGHGEWTYIDGSGLDAATGEYTFDHAWATGEYTAVAQAIYGDLGNGQVPQDWWGEYEWQTAWSGWSRTGYVKSSNLVELTVTAPNGQVRTPVMEILNGASLMRGDFVRVRVTADENAAETTVTVNDGENVLATLQTDTSGCAYFDTINMDPGKYTVKAVSTGKKGYEDSETASAVITVTEPEEGKIWIEKTEAIVGQSIRIMAYQRGGWLEIKGAGGDIDGYYASEPSGYVIQPLYLSAGEYTVTLTLRNEEEQPVNTVMEKLSWNYIGTLETPTITAPGFVRAGEDFSFSVANLDQAGQDGWRVDLYGPNGNQLHNWSSEAEPQDFAVAADNLSAAGTYRLESNVYGYGYRSAWDSVTFRVLGKRDPNLTLYVKKAGEAAFSSNAEYNVQANEMMYGRITVTGDRKPTMIMIEIPHHGELSFMEDEIEQTGDGEYTAWPGEFCFDSNGDYLVTVRVSYEEIPDDWDNIIWAGESNSVVIHVTSAGSAIPGTITLKENTVVRGVPLEVQVGEGTHVSEYNVNFMVSGGNASDVMSTRTLRQPGTVYMATTDLEPGEYNVEVYCRGEQNYDSVAAQWVSFTVTDRTGDAEFLFDVSQEAGVSQDEAWISMYYPEADRYTLYWMQDGETRTEDLYAWDEPAEYELILETGVTKAWAEAWKQTDNGEELLAVSDDILFTVTELYPDYALSVSLDQDMAPDRDHTITVNGLADADRWWTVDLKEFTENAGREEWETIRSWANWKGDLPGALTIPAETLKMGGQYSVAAEAVRYGSDQVSANRKFDLCPAAPAVTVDTSEPLVHDYVRFSVADPEIDEIRYTYEIGEGADSYENNRTLDSWEIQRKNGTSIWRFYMNQEGTRTYSFSFRKGDTWTGWTEPITITASYAGDLSVPVLTVPETLRAGEPFSVQIGKVEHADRFSVSWREKASFHPYSISVFSAGETVPERFGLDAGEYEVWVTAFGKHYRESESAFYTVSVTGKRPAAPVPDTTRISGVKAGDRLVISATAENGSRVALITPWDQLGEDLYLTENGKVQVPFTVENPDISIYLQSLVDGCWSEPSDGIQVQGEQDIGDEVQIPVTVNPSTVSQGQDVQVTINKVAGAGLYTYNVCYLDASEDPDEPIPVNVVYETAANPVFNGNRGTFTIPAYYFRYAGQYTVTVNAYQDDVWQSYIGAGTADLTVTENTAVPDAPTAKLEKDSYPYFSTVTAQVQTGGAERLVAYLLNEYGGNQYTSFTTEIIELEENQTSYEYSWLAEEPGEYALAFAVYRNGVLSRGSEKLSFTVDVPQGRLAAPKLIAPDQVTKGEAMSVSWTLVEGAESYVVEIDDAETQVVYASGVIPANQTSLEIPADELTDSGRMTVWVEARAAGMDKSWSTEKVFALEDPETAPSVVTKSWTGGTLTLEVSGITGDRLAVKINGSDAGYVAITGSGSTQTVKVPVTADTEYVQVANRATDGFNWSTFSNKAYPFYANTLKLPEGLTEIESKAFSGLAEPVNIILPAGVTRIADDAFEGSTVMLIVRNEYAEGWARDKGYSYMVQK